MRDDKRLQPVNEVEDLMSDFKFEQQDYAEDLLAAAELSEVERQRILNTVLTQAGLAAETANAEAAGAKPARPRLARRRLLAVSLVAALMVAGGSLAVADVLTDGRIAEFFGANDSQSQMLSDYSEALNIADSDQGATVTVRQVLGDNHNVFVLFDVEAPEGVKLDSPWYLFKSAYVMFEKSTSHGYYFEELADRDGKDNTLSMMLVLSSHRDLRGETLKMELGDLYTAVGDEDVVAVPGSWELEVPLEYENLAATYKLSEPVVVDMPSYHMQAALDKLELSPLTLTLSGGSDLGSLVQGELDLPEVTMDDLQIHMQDGSVVSLSSGGTSTDADTLVLTFSFNCVIDLEQIDYIEFMGQTLEYK